MAGSDSSLFKRFRLWRDADVSGTSGTGFVAEGIQFSCGKVVVSFYKELKDVANIETFDNLEDMVKIHGHEGKTKVIWYDD
jgi:hypothetical protein